MNNYLKQFKNLYNKENRKSNGNMLFFLSDRNLNGEVLMPRIPKNFFTENGFEDNITKRVCFASSIDTCLMGLSMNCKNKEFYVHVPVGRFTVIRPTVDQVPDVLITGEKWICEPVEVECIGKIRVDGEDNHPGYVYTYGDGIEDVLYRWKWHYIV